MYGHRFASLAAAVIFVIGTSTCQAKEKSVIEYLGTTYIMPDGCPTPDCDMSDPECVRTKRWILFGFTNFHCFVTFVHIPFEVRTLCTYIKALWKVTLFSPFRVASLHKCRLLPTGKSKYVNSPFRITKKDWTILKSFAISTTCNLRSL